MVTQIAQQENTYQAAFLALREEGSSRNWLHRLRESAMEGFGELGFPSVRDEEWKYTNVAPLTKVTFSPPPPSAVAEQPIPVDLDVYAYPETATSQLVFVNGILRNDLSSVAGLHHQLTAIDLREASANPLYEETVRKHLARSADYVANGFTALNTAFISGGAFIHIPK